MTTATPSDDTWEGAAARDAGLLSICPECSWAIGSTRVSVPAPVPPREYHKGNILRTRTKACGIT